jgi:aspartate aminotransferase-like enzyme
MGMIGTIATKAHMKQRLLTPGPTMVPEDTLLELARPVFYHRSAQFRQLLGEVTEGLQYVFRTRHPVLTLTASGTGGMEAAVACCLPPGSKAICCIAGRWGERWRHLCQTFGVEPICLTAPHGEPVRPEQLAHALAQHPDAAGVCATLSETATGVRNDIAAFGRLTAPTPALLLVDAISGLAAIECRTDDWHIDVCVSGSQKALMLPPGLAFVSVSDRAWQRMEDHPPERVFYFDLRKYRDALKTGDAPYTPANSLVRALKVSLDRLRAEGIENVWARHARIAAAARAGVQAMNLELFASQPADGLTVFRVPAGIDGAALLAELQKKHGIHLTGGQDTLKGKIIRLGHMGYTDQFDVLAALSALELVLLQMGHPLEPGRGVAAFQQSLARSIRTPGTGM